MVAEIAVSNLAAPICFVGRSLGVNSATVWDYWYHLQVLFAVEVIKNTGEVAVGIPFHLTLPFILLELSQPYLSILLLILCYALFVA